jgi:glycosyltransferase involved in cell wall biosynthesis
MATPDSNHILLTVVTPVALMAGRLENLKMWMSHLGLLSVEVILVHDKKDEITGVELRGIVNELEDPRIIILEGEYGGPGLARNAGLNVATGKWVCFWDSDDIPQVEDFYLMVQVAEASESECAVGGFTAVHDTSGAKKSHLLSKNYLEEIAINPGIWRFAFKRSALEGLWFSSLMMAEDQVFLAGFRIPDRRIEIFAKSVYQYFIGENYHLTNSKESLKDLPRAIGHTMSLIHTLTAGNIYFVSILLSRQVITAVRTGNIANRFDALGIFFLGLGKAGGKKRREMLKSLWFVLWNRESIL